MAWHLPKQGPVEESWYPTLAVSLIALVLILLAVFL